MNYTDFEFDEALKQRLDSLYSQNRQPHAIVIEGADAEKCKGACNLSYNEGGVQSRK